MATILVVDDYAVTQRVISFMLQRTEHKVLTASNGQEGLNLLAETPVDLAIIDVAMPVMDGLTMLKHLRADPRYAEVPVIMLTASGVDHHRLEATEVGADAFLTKPASSQELTATVTRLLKNRTDRAPSEA